MLKRLVTKQDIVPKMPGFVFEYEGLEKWNDIAGSTEWLYTCFEAELKLDIRSSPFLKRRFDLLGFHSIET